MRASSSLEEDDMSSMLIPRDSSRSSTKYQSISVSIHFFDHNDPNMLHQFYYYNINEANLNASISSNKQRQKLQKQLDFSLFASSKNWKDIKISSSSIETTSFAINGTSRLRMLPERSEELHTYFYGLFEKAKIDAAYISRKSRQAILSAV